MIILVRQLKRAVRIDDITMYRKDLSIFNVEHLPVTVYWFNGIKLAIREDAHHILRSRQKSNWPKHWAERNLHDL
ncbi:uncharacterized protein OCT59_009578 [Rhizophagus irregularis]|uniref:uncharacterized protein n=1 Tax=Rhizophagus irregularis TaxID=588596 RepID=UPI003333A12C|nr:hypothetical protein OCT59_009578 [Rhizophagus irregularis]